MAFTHGRVSVFKINAKDLSTYAKTYTLTRSADVHDVTGFGATAHAKQGGLLDGKMTVGGTYDDSATNGPRGVIYPLLGTSTAIILQPEGTATTKAQDSFNAVVTSYEQTGPVDDMVTWKLELEINGVDTVTAQP
jgi:predicted secreted protein